MQTNMPREIKDIIRNVQQMDLPENGIADIRIKIQGGDVMDRPMFKKGGGANKFPDLSGDGKVTQKDILIGRGVIEKQEGGAVNPEQAISEVAAASEAEGEQLGLDYLAKQMGGIDMAEDAEGLINALRGNEMPISARRTELAEYVGEEDAMRTPESVLAMVQPTIMMTEEGAMNSGIGELMQQLTSDVEMATEGGAPTDMGQGVGALMMAGAPEQPVQQFAAGGPVVRMAEAGDPSLEQRFQQYLPFFQNIQGVDAEDREKDRALALARAGFQLAAGVGPKGENISGRPFLSQLGTVGQTALGDLAAIRAGERKSDSALRSMAAKAAIDAQTAADTATRQMALEQTKLDRSLAELLIKEGGLMDRLRLTEKGKGERQEAKGKQELTQLDVKGDQAMEQIERKGDQALEQIAARGDQARQTAVLGSDLKVREINIQNILDMKRDAAQNNKPVDKVLSDGMGNQQVLRIFPDGQTTVFGVGQEGKFAMDSPGKMRQGVLKNVTSYGSGTLSPEVTTDVESSIDIIYKPTGPQKILSEGLPLNLAIAIDKRAKAGFPMNIDETIIKDAQKMVADPVNTTLSEAESLADQGEKLKTFIPEGLNIEGSFGGLSGPARVLRYINDQLVDVDPTGFYRDAMSIPDDAKKDIVKSDVHLNALADETLKLLYEELGNARLKAIVDVIQAEVAKIRPGAVSTDTQAYQQAQILYKKLLEAEQQANKIYKIDPKGTHDDKDFLIAKNMVENQLPILLRSFENLIDSLGVATRGVVDQGPGADVIGGRAAQSQKRFENLLQDRK